MKNLDFKQDVQTICRIIKQAGITQEQLANAIGASQSQVSRILSGKSSRRTKLFEELCIYAKSLLTTKSCHRVTENADLVHAIESVWDGSPDHAKALASVIRSLAALHSTSNQRTDVQQEAK